MPFKPKERHPGADEAVARVEALHRQIDAVRTERAEAVRDALDKGATLRELAGRLGLSVEGVRKIRGA